MFLICIFDSDFSRKSIYFFDVLKQNLDKLRKKFSNMCGGTKKYVRNLATASPSASACFRNFAIPSPGTFLSFRYVATTYRRIIFLLNPTFRHKLLQEC